MAERILPKRFLDADEEPSQILSSINNYQNCPLVSLEEAIRPIEPLLLHCNVMIGISRRGRGKPMHELTIDESIAIQLYTSPWPLPSSDLSTLLNQQLRSQSQDTLSQWFPFLKLFYNSLYKLPSFKGTVWRGAHGNLIDQYNEDHVWYGISSCTTSFHSIQESLKFEGDRTLFCIECLNGKSIQNHSYLHDVDEIILMPKSYFEVINKFTPTEGMHIICLREKPSSPYITSDHAV